MALDTASSARSIHDNRDRHTPRASSLAFCLFLTLTAAIFLRPADIIESFKGLPIYEGLILACSLACFPTFINQLRWSVIESRPWTFFVLGMLPAIMLADLAHGDQWAARMDGFSFAKVLVYYYLLFGCVDSLQRLRMYLIALVCFVAAIASLALLEYHGVVNIPSLAAMQQHERNDAFTGDAIITVRMMATGMFNDPNDFSLILGAAVLISLFWAVERHRIWVRATSTIVILVLVYALALTRSRGGFLALLSGLAVFMVTRFGWRRLLVVGVVALPAILFVFSGRQMRIDISDKSDTAQGRVELWSESLLLFRTAPIFGVGVGQLREQNGLVAHNSYIHCYAELGFLGGTFFFGSVFLLIRNLSRSVTHARSMIDADLRTWRPYILAMTIAYSVGMFSLSRCYELPTYLVLGIGGTYCVLLKRRGVLASTPLGLRLLREITLASMGWLLFLYLFVRTFARF